MSGYPLQKIEIDGFRGLRDFALQDLGGVNVLVGGNNSGKTSLLEAIAVLCAPLDPYRLLDVVRQRDPGGIDESRLHSLRWCFHRAAPLADPDELISARCELRCLSSIGLERLVMTLDEFRGEPSPDERKRAGRSGSRQMDVERTDQERRGADVIYRSDFVFKEDRPRLSSWEIPMRIWDGMPITRFGKDTSPSQDSLACEVLYPYSYQMNRLQVQSLSRLDPAQGQPSVAELLQQFDADVIGVDIRSSQGLRPSIYLQHRRLGLAPLSVFGDAMRRSVLLASTLSALPAGSVLLIDEAEAGVHVGAQPRFFAWLMQAARRRQVQVFMTTHSLEALDAMLSGLPPAADEHDLVVWQLRRDGTEAQCRRFAGDLLHRLRFERGLDLR